MSAIMNLVKLSLHLLILQV